MTLRLPYLHWWWLDRSRLAHQLLWVPVPSAAPTTSTSHTCDDFSRSHRAHSTQRPVQAYLVPLLVSVCMLSQVCCTGLSTLARTLLVVGTGKDNRTENVENQWKDDEDRYRAAIGWDWSPSWQFLLLKFITLLFVELFTRPFKFFLWNLHIFKINS